jgi:hypothetical protein
LGYQEQQSSDDNRANDHENDIEQEPHQDRYEGNKEDNGRALKEFYLAQRLWRQAFLMQIATPVFQLAAGGPGCAQSRIRGTEKLERCSGKPPSTGAQKRARIAPRP